MNYYNFVNTILETAKSHKLVYEVGEGDIYEHLNSGDHKYPCVFLTVQNVDSNGDQMTVTGSLFYVDALLSDTSNKLQIQSTGMTTLQQIFMRLMDNYPDFDLRTGRYTPFDEKFADLCAGVFSNFTISFMDDTCIVNDDIFEGDEPITPEPEGKYMTITVDDSVAGETIIEPQIHGSITPPNLQYRVNSGDWNYFICGTTDSIHVFAGDCVQFKGVNENGLSVDYNNYLNFAISGNTVHLSGSIMSLIDGIGECDTIPNDYCFCNLFNSAKVKTVSKYFLSATHLKENCYNSLFYWCESLEIAPSLPAEVLVPRCYNMTFAGCTALETAPKINATTLAEYCFLETFAYCSSLKTTPELNYMNLEQGCYYEMFKQCTSLETAPSLPATNLKSVCYYGLFDGCTSLVNAPALPSLEPAYNCYYRMFRGCTSLKTAPELPATVLSKTGGVSGCYESMFENCTSLVTPPALPATVLSNGCYNSMFKGCTSLETAPELPAVSLEYYCYEQMFSGCEKLTQAPVLNAPTLVIHCYYEMFKNCKNLNYVKCLATDIHESDGTETSALTDWLSGVATTGTFVKKYGFEYLINSPSGIPQGWTVEEIDAPIPPEPEPKYMTITVLDNAGETIIKPTVTGSLPNLNLQYRINNGEWSDFIVGTTADIKVGAGDAVQFKGVNESGLSIDYDNYLNFSISGNPVTLSGNIMSLIDGVGETLVIPNRLCFQSLFYNSSIKTVSLDFLPATTLSEECYRSLFSYCSNLTQVPSLPATTLATYCYEEMFSGCSALKQAPELPATTLVDSCYNYMFLYCSSLNYVKCLATDNISTSTILGWLSGVSSTGTFVKPAGVSYETGDSGIPEGWTVEEI